jgi:hypothetical protein
MILRGSDTLELQSTVAAKYVICSAGAAVNLYYNNNKKLETTNTGIFVDGNVTATSFYGDGSNLTNIVAASVGTSATLETRIAGVSSTFATTSATLATSIANAAAAAVAFAIALG